MAYTTINKSSDYFNTKLYTGTGSTNAITGVGFQPDWVWLKERAGVGGHNIFDAVRGVTKVIYSNGTNAESTEAQALTTFGTDGFTLGTNTNVNESGMSMVGWNWKANGAGSANTDGTISSTVSANTTAGFSIVSYTGNGQSTATVGHGLGVAPSMIIFKRRSTTANWFVYHKSLGAGKSLKLNATDAESSNTISFGNTTPTSSVFTVGDDGGDYGTNYPNGRNIIAYCFAEKQGYSKFGSYVGNGNADGTFIYTGFKPAFFITKNITTGSSSWMMYDNKRDPDNQMAEYLYPNTSAAAGTSSSGFDFLSNGIKIRNTFGDANVNGNTFIYIAFAEAPLVGSNNVPCTAR